MRSILTAVIVNGLICLLLHDTKAGDQGATQPEDLTLEDFDKEEKEVKARFKEENSEYHIQSCELIHTQNIRASVFLVQFSNFSNVNLNRIHHLNQGLFLW